MKIDTRADTKRDKECFAFFEKIDEGKAHFHGNPWHAFPTLLSQYLALAPDSMLEEGVVVGRTDSYILDKKALHKISMAQRHVDLQEITAITHWLHRKGLFLRHGALENDKDRAKRNEAQNQAHENLIEAGIAFLEEREELRKLRRGSTAEDYEERIKEKTAAPKDSAPSSKAPRPPNPAKVAAPKAGNSIDAPEAEPAKQGTEFAAAALAHHCERLAITEWKQMLTRQVQEKYPNYLVSQLNKQLSGSEGIDPDVLEIAIRMPQLNITPDFAASLRALNDEAINRFFTPDRPR